MLLSFQPEDPEFVSLAEEGRSYSYPGFSEEISTALLLQVNCFPNMNAALERMYSSTLS